MPHALVIFLETAGGHAAIAEPEHRAPFLFGDAPGFFASASAFGKMAPGAEPDGALVVAHAFVDEFDGEEALLRGAQSGVSVTGSERQY